MSASTFVTPIASTVEAIQDFSIELKHLVSADLPDARVILSSTGSLYKWIKNAHTAPCYHQAGFIGFCEEHPFIIYSLQPVESDQGLIVFPYIVPFDGLLRSGRSSIVFRGWLPSHIPSPTRLSHNSWISFDGWLPSQNGWIRFRGRIPTFELDTCPQDLTNKHALEIVTKGIIFPYLSHRSICMDQDKIKSDLNPTSTRLMAPVHIYPRRFIDTHTLRLVEFNADVGVPPYAILSHTWSCKEEVSYLEYLQPRHETFRKSGYLKILAACGQARGDGFRIIWIDTCCVQQGNHEDVVANITSMYAYYQNAQVCYVYLADALNGSLRNISRRNGSSFYRWSEWFSRGWTLQELLAPRTVVFFDKNWRRIGDKHQLQDDIHRITTIPPTVLSGKQSIQDVDVLDRMSWSIWRRTTRRQDSAYCLQGILGVIIEPDYNESRSTSFNRLGRALFNAQPELKEKLGIGDDMFCDPEDWSFWNLLLDRVSAVRYNMNSIST